MYPIHLIAPLYWLLEFVEEHPETKINKNKNKNKNFNI
jgi:hypothetical protein